MKKLKFLLLGGIIILLSIGSFSNAQFISEVTESFDIPHNGRVSLPKSITGYIIESSNCRILNIYSPQATNYNSNNFMNCASFPCYIPGSSVNGYVDFEVGYKLSYCNYGVSFDLNYISKSSKIPFSALSPAITGVKDVAFQMIPFVIYVAIGLLVCSIGFVAIRWLLSWLWIKIKSIFSSKRG